MAYYEIKFRATRVVTETWVLRSDVEVDDSTAMSALADGIVNRHITSVADDPDQAVTRELLSVHEVTVNEDAQSLTED